MVGPDGDGAAKDLGCPEGAEIAAIVAVATSADHNELVGPERHTASPHREQLTTAVGAGRDCAQRSIDEHERSTPAHLITGGRTEGLQEKDMMRQVTARTGKVRNGSRQANGDYLAAHCHNARQSIQADWNAGGCVPNQKGSMQEISRQDQQD